MIISKYDPSVCSVQPVRPLFCMLCFAIEHVKNVYIINQINNWTNVRAYRAYMRKTTMRSIPGNTFIDFKYAVRFQPMLVKLSIW